MRLISKFLKLKIVTDILRGRKNSELLVFRKRLKRRKSKAKKNDALQINYFL